MVTYGVFCCPHDHRQDASLTVGLHLKCLLVTAAGTEATA